jgi:phosphoribosylaminoimidazole-succinocarboxamide synthase
LTAKTEREVMSFEIGEKIYEGKAKIVFNIMNEPDLVYQEFKDSLTAFNGEKKGSFSAKGHLNREISSMIFQRLTQKGISNHWVENRGEIGMVTKRVDIIPVEVVVRNIAAGSLAKRLGWEEGRKLPHTIVEYYYKSDKLGDPMINEDHIKILGLCDASTLSEVRRMAELINGELLKIFSDSDLDLVDFKLEFGKTKKGEIILADEISPDTCRLWDKKTGEKLDKDRFRRDLGNIEEAYKNVRRRVELALKKG